MTEKRPLWRVRYRNVTISMDIVKEEATTEKRPIWVRYGDAALSILTPDLSDRMVTATVWLFTAGILTCPILILAP